MAAIFWYLSKLVLAFLPIMAEANKGRISRNNLNPETLQDLQGCVYKWQQYNFEKDQDIEYTLMGICEESGELCHAQLKLEQNIRGSAEEHEEEMFDAVGDMMIYIMNYMSGMGWVLNPFSPLESVEKTDNQKTIRKAVFAIYRLVAKLVETPELEDKAHQIVRQINYFCKLKGWDPEHIIRTTWAQVGQRDWKKYPGNGLPPEKKEITIPT